MAKTWDSLQETVRYALAHRREWALPIGIVAESRSDARSMHPARYRAIPADGPEELLGRAVFSLGPTELAALAPVEDDFLALGQVLENIVQEQAERLCADLAQ